MREAKGDTLGSLHQRMAEPPTRRRGITQLIVGTIPAAGSNYTRTIPGEYWERPISLAFTYTAGAASAIRSVAYNILDGDGHIINQTQIATGIIASSSFTAYGDLQITSPITPGVSPNAEGSLTSPGAGATIAGTAVLPAGEYLVTVEANLAGTLVQGTDANNLQLVNSGLTFSERIDNSIQVGTQTFGPYVVELPAGNSIQLDTVGAGTTGSIYSGSLIIQPTTYQGSFTFPDITLQSGWQQQIAVGNIQAADTLTAIYLLTERYSSNFANGGMRDEEERELRHLISGAVGGNWG
jgi:hypothetical protein